MIGGNESTLRTLVSYPMKTKRAQWIYEWQGLDFYELCCLRVFVLSYKLYAICVFVCATVCVFVCVTELQATPIVCV